MSLQAGREGDREKVISLLVILGLIGFLWLKSKPRAIPPPVVGEGVLTIYGVM